MPAHPASPQRRRQPRPTSSTNTAPSVNPIDTTPPMVEVWKPTRLFQLQAVDDAGPTNEPNAECQPPLSTSSVHGRCTMPAMTSAPTVSCNDRSSGVNPRPTVAASPRASPTTAAIGSTTGAMTAAPARVRPLMTSERRPIGAPTAVSDSGGPPTAARTWPANHGRPA